MLASSLNWGSDVGPIVFGWWQVCSPMGLAASTLVVMWIAIAHEWLGRRLLRAEGLAQAKPVVYGLKYCLSVFLMLVVMTFNGFLILGSVVGVVAGYCLFRAEDDEQALCEC